MSTFEVKVRRVTVMPHPNADRLELGTVDDFHVVILKDQFHTEDLAVYIPEQAIMPPDLITTLGLDGKLAGPNYSRVKAIRLRGELSQGLLYQPDAWPEHWVEGTDVAEELGIVKWEPPIPVEMSGHAAQAPYGGFFRTYTDIENIKAVPYLLIPGEEVVITEKLHGSCLVSGLIDGERVISSKGISSHGLVLQESDENVYWRAARQEGIFEKLAAYLSATGQTQVMLFGEVLGVQDLKYGFAPGSIGFRAFDLYTPQGFVDHDEFTAFCVEYGMPQVPVLYRGPFSKEVMLQHTNGRSTLATHLREGVVIRPIHERIDWKRGRIIFKSVSDDYLMRQNGTEMQ